MLEEEVIPKARFCSPGFSSQTFFASKTFKNLSLKKVCDVFDDAAALVALTASVERAAPFGDPHFQSLHLTGGRITNWFDLLSLQELLI